MQFGNTKTISGQVPWDTTTSSNVMQLTAYPFFNVESGSTYSLEGTYNGAGSNIQIVDGTFTTLDELDLTFSVPSELIGQTGASFILMFEDTEQNRDYFVYNVTGLTLEDEPTPQFSITSNTQTAILTNNGVLQGDQASSRLSGSLPLDNSAETVAIQGQPINQFNFTITTNNKGFFQSGDIVKVKYKTNFNSEDSIDHLLVFNNGVGSVTINSHILGQGKTDAYRTATISIIRPGADYPTTSSDYTTIVTQTIILEPYLELPIPSENHNFIELSPITIDNVTYQVSDFVTGGSITRNNALGSMSTTLDGMNFKYVSIDGGITYGYYLPFNKVDNCTRNNYPENDYPVNGIRVTNSNFGTSSDNAINQVTGYTSGNSTMLVKINPIATNPYSQSSGSQQSTNGTTWSSLGWSIALKPNCTFEDPPIVRTWEANILMDNTYPFTSQTATISPLTISTSKAITGVAIEDEGEENYAYQAKAIIDCTDFPTVGCVKACYGSNTSDFDWLMEGQSGFPDGTTHICEMTGIVDYNANNFGVPNGKTYIWVAGFTDEYSYTPITPIYKVTVDVSGLTIPT